MSQTQHDDGLPCYAIDQKMTTILTMGVGKFWWNYIIEFNSDGIQNKVFIENKRGIMEQQNKRLIRYWTIRGDERVKSVVPAYECKDGELFITWAADNLMNLTLAPIQ